MSLSKSEAAGVLIAPETIGSLGVQPTTGWRTLQPDQDQITDFYLNIKTVAPSPISVERQMQAPVIVDADASPKLQQDLTGDLLNDIGEGIVLAKAKHNGGTGQSFFIPTSASTTDYVVTALGALPAGTLVKGTGWVNAANNGLRVVGASSTGISIKVTGGVAETPGSAYLATVEVAGFRGASGDIKLDVNGNLTSTVADFTTMGLVAGQWIYVGGVPGSAFAFATSGYSGFAKIAITPTANLITLARRAWTVGAADTGTGKTIDLYFCRWLRNVSTTDADYQEQSYQMELSLSGIGGGGATEYVYAAGQMVGMFELDAPLASLVKTTISFIGTNVTDPSTSRATGASTAPVSVAIDRFNTSTTEPYIKFANAATEASVSTDIASWKLSMDNGITGQKQHGTLGPKRLIVGKLNVTMDLEVVVTQDDAIKACTANTTLTFGAGLRSTTGGVFVDVPSLKFTGAVPKFPANGAVMISPKAGAFVDATGRYTVGFSYFSYLPAS